MSVGAFIASAGRVGQYDDNFFGVKKLSSNTRVYNARRTVAIDSIRTSHIYDHPNDNFHCGVEPFEARRTAKVALEIQMSATRGSSF